MLASFRDATAGRPHAPSVVSPPLSPPAAPVATPALSRGASGAPFPPTPRYRGWLRAPHCAHVVWPDLETVWPPQARQEGRQAGYLPRMLPSWRRVAGEP